MILDFQRKCVRKEIVLLSKSISRTFAKVMLRLRDMANMAENFKDSNSLPEMFLRKDILKICSKFTREQTC